MWNIGRLVYILIVGYDLTYEDGKIIVLKDRKLTVATDGDKGMEVVRVDGEENLVENLGNVSEEAKVMVTVVTYTRSVSYCVPYGELVYV